MRLTVTMGHAEPCLALTFDRMGIGKLYVDAQRWVVGMIIRGNVVVSSEATASRSNAC